MHTRAVVLAADAIGRQIVSVHAKLTYRLQSSGACVLAEEQAPLLNVDGDKLDEGAPHELDVIPHKAATDLIVMASAHAPGRRPTPRLEASLAFGTLERRFLVHGDRRCLYRGRGSVAFSEPAPFASMPLRYELAYGGCDPYIDPPAPRTLLETLNPHPGLYPRNPAGRGYVVKESRELMDRLLLPNVEDPDDPLTPERLITGSPQNWWRQPLPWSCDWFDQHWYPRSVYLGAVPDFLPDDDRGVEEVRRGWAPARQNARLRKATLPELFDPRCSDAATPGLVVPFMKGDEAIRLRGMTPSGELVVRLPGQRPRMEVRYAGKTGMKTVEITPVPNRVLVSTDEAGVYVVWHGAFAPPPALLERAARGDVPEFEAYVDGQRAPSLS